MKASRWYLILFLLSSIFCCKEKGKIENNTVLVEEKNKVVFKIDERTEFFRTIFNLSVQDLIDEDLRPCETNYLTRVNNHFSAFKNHPLIKALYDNENIMIDFSTIGLLFNDFENFVLDPIYEKELSGFGITKNEIDSLRPLFIDFYKQSNFKLFFKNNQDYYRNALEGIENQINEEQLFDKVVNFYQSDTKGLELVIFVELTNNANNKAVTFYDKYNPKKRAIILANICDSPEIVTSSNTILELDNNIRGRIYHETTHLFTNELLDKYIGKLNQYKTLCKDCSATQIKDKIDHFIVYPIQGLLSSRWDKNNEGDNFYLNKCEDIRKDIYKKLKTYDPEKEISFETIYRDCITLIKNSASKI